MPVLRRFKYGNLVKYPNKVLYESLDKLDNYDFYNDHISTLQQMVNNLPQRDIYHGHVDIWFCPIKQDMDITVTLMILLKDWKLSNHIKIKP